MKLRNCLVFLPALFAAATSLGATTIDFNTLSGANGTPFSSYTEKGFTVTATSGNWFVAQLSGNPIPDVFCDNCGAGTLQVTNGGQFDFSRVDIGSATGRLVPFSITGFLGGIQVLSQTGSAGNAFATFNSVNGTQMLDKLNISLNTGGNDGNVDNIVLTTGAGTPEPGTILLALTGIGGLVIGSRRRRDPAE